MTRRFYGTGTAFKIWLQVLVLVFSTSILFSQTTAKELIPYSKDGKWGYMDEDKVVVIDPKFDAANFFQNSLGATDSRYARVQLGGKYGVINEQGEEILPIGFDSIEARSILTTTGAYGVIHDPNGMNYFDASGQTYDSLPGTRSWVCGIGVYQDYLIIDKVEVLPHTEDTFNYGYVRYEIIRDSSTFLTRSDSVYTLLDSIVRFQSKRVQLQYRSDGKVDICRMRTDRGGRLIYNVCLTYDEVSALRNGPKVFGRAYWREIRVRQGESWGIVDLKTMSGSKVTTDYRRRWEIVPPKYEAIRSKAGKYFLVEYSKDQYGYIDAKRGGPVMEYWLVE